MVDCQGNSVRSCRAKPDIVTTKATFFVSIPTCLDTHHQPDSTQRLASFRGLPNLTMDSWRRCLRTLSEDHTFAEPAQLPGIKGSPGFRFGLGLQPAAFVRGEMTSNCQLGRKRRIS